MRRIDYSFLKEKLPSTLVGLTDIVADLNAKEGIRKLQYVETFEKLKKKAVIESVKGSNAIEGIITTDDRIREIIAGAVPISHDEKEISGYRDALSLIHSNHANIDISERFIQQLHQYLVSDTNPQEAGRYKSRDNLIMEYDSEGKRRVRFNPVSAEETPDAMEQLILAYVDARQDMYIPQLYLIPCVIVDFLCIHPFRDGNGRVSRLLTVLMLYIADYDICQYISLENQINKYKDSYYASLEESSKGWHEGENDYTPFIVYFMQIIYRCFKELDESFMDISLKKAKKNERIEAILMSSVVPISKAEILDKLPDVSVKTVELTISKLLKQEKIRKVGSYRDARYIVK